MATDLPRAALALRVAHAGITAAMLLAIAEVWRAGLTGRRGRFLRAAEVALVVESVLVVANRGDCPLGRLQERLGDPVPLFELVLTPRAAKLAVPTLGAVAVGGFAVLAWRSRGGRQDERASEKDHRAGRTLPGTYGKRWSGS